MMRERFKLDGSEFIVDKTYCIVDDIHIFKNNIGFKQLLDHLIATKGWEIETAYSVTCEVINDDEDFGHMWHGLERLGFTLSVISLEHFVIKQGLDQVHGGNIDTCKAFLKGLKYGKGLL